MAIGLPIPSRTAANANAARGLPSLPIASRAAAADACAGLQLGPCSVGASGYPGSERSVDMWSPGAVLPPSPERKGGRRTVCRRRMIPTHGAKKMLQEVYEIEEGTVGEGGFGVVRRARLRAGGPERAVKSVSKRSHSANYLDAHEIAILRRLDHPCICRLIESFEDEKFIYLVLEYIEGRELFDEILERRVLDEQYAANIMRQVFGALHYCHGHIPAVIHRDLKPENIMVQQMPSEKGSSCLKHQVKLIDFGLAVMCPHLLQANLVGSRDYIAPESLARGTYSPASDMWSAGVVLHTLLCGCLPGEDVSNTPLLRNSAVSAAARELVQGLLRVNPDERLTAAEVILHPWVREVANNVPSQSASGLLMSSFLGFHRSQKLRRAALTAVAMQLNDAHLQELREQFLLIDTDCDGKISREELVLWVSSGAPARDVRSWAEKVFESIDTDGSGCIEFSEWAAAALQETDCEDAVRAAFRVFDSDNDGQIRVGEIGHLFNLSDKEASRYVKQHDLNGDGMIDFHEFKTMLSSEPKFSPPPSAMGTPLYPAARSGLVTPLYLSASPAMPNSVRAAPLVEWLLELSNRHANGTPATTPASARLSAALRLQSPLWTRVQPPRQPPGPTPIDEEPGNLSPFQNLFEDSSRSAMQLEPAISPMGGSLELRRAAVQALQKGALGLQLELFNEDDYF